MTPEQKQHRRRELADRDYWTASETAFMLRVTVSTVTRWISQGLDAEKRTLSNNTTVWIIDRLEANRWWSDPDRATRRKKPS